MLQEVLAVASTVLLSLGGAGAIILGLSSWLGRVWAEKILQNARYEHELRVEKLRAQLQRDVESELERLRYRNHGEIDEMMRTREVYQCLVTSMRAVSYTHLSANSTLLDKSTNFPNIAFPNDRWHCFR